MQINRPSVRASGAGALLALFLATPALAQKATMAIRGFEATPAVRAAAEAAGTLNALEQIVQGAEGQMEAQLQRTQKFDIVARGDLSTILGEQDLAASGLVDRLDPASARGFQLAGARYVTILTVDGFQDITDRTVLQKQLGATEAERRMIQLSGVVRVYDTTSGRLLSSAPLRIDRNELEEVIPGVERTGNTTQAVLATVAASLASESAEAITSAVFPAKVLAYSFGQVSFNRTAASGVVAGQVWEVMHTGPALVDPDTGAELGSEEVPVGWARVTEAGERFSKAQAIVDNGIQKGSLMRYRPQGLPAGIDPGGTAGGSDRSGAATTAPAPAAGSGAPSGQTEAAKTAARAPAEAAGRSARTFAIFTRLLDSDLPASSTARLEEEITACLSGQGVSVVSRADLVNGVARFAGDGPNTGSPESPSRVVEQALSEQASAVRLAELLGADAILVASITNYTIDDRAFNDPSLGVRSEVRTFTLGVSLRVVDGGTGRSIYGGSADASESIRRTAELTQEVDPIDDLLQEASRNVCRRSSDAMRALPAPTVADAGEVELSIALVASGLEVPDIVADPDGRFTVASARLPISLVGARVLVDGVLAGTAPGTLGTSPGLHRLTIEHPLFTPLQQVVNVRPGPDGQQLRFAMDLSDSGRRRWVENIEVLEALKDGEVLRESQLTAIRAFAEFLRNSNVRIDTSQVRNLNVGGRSIWAQLLGE